MSHIIIIREYRQSDEIKVRNIVRQSLLSLTGKAFSANLAKEITFQSIVLLAAVMFIFVGLPIAYCMAALPIIIFLVYICVYVTLMLKSFEQFQEKSYQCFVAEACEPFASSNTPQKINFSFFTEYEIMEKNIDVGSLQRKVIGTVALKKHRVTPNCCWLYRLAIDEKYRRKGIGRQLVLATVNWSKIQGFHNIEASLSEHQDAARKLFIHLGFHLRQLYHKQVIGSALTLLKFQFSLNLFPDF